MQWEVEGGNRIVHERVDRRKPVIDRSVAVPALAHAEWFESFLVLVQVAYFRDGFYHPGTVAFNEIETKAVKANLLN